MNKALLIVLLVILVALGAYALLRPTPDTKPTVKLKEDSPDPFRRDPGGVPTDEPGDFHVEVEAKRVGPRNVLEFTVTESRGWGAKGVYITFWHQVKNAETGEWERGPNAGTVTTLAEHPLMLGEVLVHATTLTGIELEQFGGELGQSEAWEAEVSQTMEIRKPE